MMLNWAPLRIFDFAVSGTTSTYGTNFGAMANIHMTGFNFFIGTDCFITNLNEDFIPKDNMKDLDEIDAEVARIRAKYKK